jgi:hypothetical protein
MDVDAVTWNRGIIKGFQQRKEVAIVAVDAPVAEKPQQVKPTAGGLDVFQCSKNRWPCAKFSSFDRQIDPHQLLGNDPARPDVLVTDFAVAHR